MFTSIFKPPAASRRKGSSVVVSRTAMKLLTLCVLCFDNFRGYDYEDEEVVREKLDYY